MAPGETKCEGKSIPFKIFDDYIWTELTWYLFEHPTSQVNEWRKENQPKKTYVNRLKRALAQSERDYKAEEAKDEKLIPLYLDKNSLFTKEELDKEKHKIETAKDTLQDKIKELNAEIDAIEGKSITDEQMKEHKPVLEMYVGLVKEKIESAPVSEKRRLLDYLLGKGFAIKVARPYDVMNTEHRRKLLESRFPVHRRPRSHVPFPGDWQFEITTRMDLAGFIFALRSFYDSGTIPPYDTYLEDKGYIFTSEE